MKDGNELTAAVLLLYSPFFSVEYKPQTMQTILLVFLTDNLLLWVKKQVVGVKKDNNELKVAVFSFFRRYRPNNLRQLFLYLTAIVLL